MSLQRFASPLPYPFSRAVRAGDFVFLSGQVPMDANGQVVRGDIQTQTHAVMARIRESLEVTGASLQDVVRVTVWLSDLAQFAGFNEAYATHFAADHLPTRSTVQARLALDVDVEVEVQAYLPR